MNGSNRIEAQSLLEQAQASLRAGCPETAWRQADQALRHWPDFPPARLLLAQALTQLQRCDESMRTLDVITQQDARWHQAPAVRHARAINLLNLGQNDAALALAQSLSNDHPDDVSLAWLLWDIHRQRQDHDRSIHAMERILTLSPDDPTAHRLYAVMLEKQNPAKAAAIYLRLLQTEDHQDAVLGLRTLTLLIRSGQLAQAAETASQLLKRHPDDAELLHQAGVLADELGHDANACHRLGQAIRQRSNGKAWIDLAKVHLHAGRISSAAGCFWKARRFTDVADQALAGLLVTALAGHRSSLVQRLHQQLVRLIPNQPQRQQLLHRFWPDLIAGQLVSPIPGKRSSVNPTDHKNLNDLLAHAHDVLADHAKRFPERADAHYHLAQCQTALGQRTSANASVERAMAINPRYRAARQLWFRLSSPPQKTDQSPTVSISSAA